MIQPNVYYLFHEGQRHGPFTLTSLSKRPLSADMLVSQGQAWVPIMEIPELRPYVRPLANGRPLAPPPNLRSAAATAARTGFATGPSAAGRPAPVPPPPKPAVNTNAADAVAAAPDSSTATTIGILNIIIGILGIVCWPIAIYTTMISRLDDLDGLLRLFVTPEARLGRALVLSVGALLSMPLLLSGIGLVRRRRWGRYLAIATGLLGLGLKIVSLMIGGTVVLAPAFKAAMEIDTPEAWTAATFLLVSTGCDGCGGVVYNIVLLIAMNLSSVKRSLG